MVDEGGRGWQAGSCFFGIMEHSETSGQAQDPARMIFSLETSEVQQEFDRIKNIDGVTVIKEPYEMATMWIATFADPDGNYFQLMSPWQS